jgi:hypothetical protein
MMLSLSAKASMKHDISMISYRFLLNILTNTAIITMVSDPTMTTIVYAITMARTTIETYRSIFSLFKRERKCDCHKCNYNP